MDITVKTGEKNISLADADDDRLLSDVLHDRGIMIQLPCGGTGKCKECMVTAEYLSSDERVISEEKILSCQTRIKELYAKAQEVNAGAADSHCTAIAIRIVIPADRLMDYEESAMVVESHSDSVSKDSGNLSEESVRDYAGNLSEDTVVDYAGDSLWKNHRYYCAVDIGTTSVVVELMDSIGRIAGTYASANRQRIYGADIMSRIKAAYDRKNALRMQKLITDQLTEGISALLRQTKDPDAYVEAVAVAANTTMCHLLTGDDTSGLGSAPFDPGDISLRHENLCSDDGTSYEMYILPGISAFVGGDILSGIYFLDLDKSDKINFLLDLGTNGEMVLGHGRFKVSSAAAGPAFEAADISCGCSSVPGAIRRVRIDKRGRCHPEVIPYAVQTDINGSSAAGSMLNETSAQIMQHRLKEQMRRPVGLCGSGLVSAVSEMLKSGIINEHGTFTSERYVREGYPLWSMPGQEPVVLTQDDIRQLQTAKSAIRTGVDTLLTDDVDTVYLSGGFGKGIDITAAINIGLLPERFAEKTVSAGNTSLKGAEKFIRELFISSDDNPKSINELNRRFERIRSESDEIVLADAAGFADSYIENMDFKIHGS